MKEFNMKNNLLLPALFFLIMILASCGTLSPEDYIITDNDEYELYNLMIRQYSEIHDLDFFHIYLDINKRGGILHPDSQEVTVRPYQKYHFYYFGSPCDSEIAISFIKNNDTTHYLDESRLDTPAVGMLHDDFNAYWHRDSLPRGYGAYYQDYPESRGIVGFSRPGFNVDKTKAIMYYGRYYGMLGAMGGLAIFEKIDGKWTRVWNMFHWIS